MIWNASRQVRLACVGLVMLLAACGGGGGGGGDSSDLSTAPGISLSPTNLSFAAVHNGALPPSQNVSISITRPSVFLGLAIPAGNPPSWLNLQSAQLTTTNWTAAITTTSLSPGNYSATISIGIADGGGNILAFRNVQVSYTVTAAPIAVSPNTLNFSSVVGGSLRQHSLSP